jgi:hypothetical protein
MTPANPDPQTATPAGELVPVIQADRNLWRTLIGLPERNMRRRENGEPVVDALQLLAAHRLAHAKEQAAGVDAIRNIVWRETQAVWWQASEDEEHETRLRVCRERRKQWPGSDDDCEHDGRCEECASDMAEAHETEASKAVRAAGKRIIAALEALAAPASSVPDSAQLVEALEALEPFARLARPINGEEGRPTYIEAIGGDDAGEELQLSTYVGNGTRIEVLDAEDFRRAARVVAALSAASGEGER